MMKTKQSGFFNIMAVLAAAVYFICLHFKMECLTIK